MKYIKAISAELIKLRYMPIISLTIFALGSIWVIMFVAHYLDVNNVVQLGKNPWGRLVDSGAAIYGVFIVTPYLILLIGAAVFLEFQSNTWKFLYTVPSSRSLVFYAKLSAIILTLLWSIFILVLGLFVIGWILHFLFPEIEFGYYRPDFSTMGSSFKDIILGSLGIIGIQYFLSHRFRGFLVPASFGILAFVVGIIISTLNNSLAHFYPYSYPAVVKDHNMFLIDEIGIIDYGIINSIELYSIIYFIFFVGLANIIEVRKQIT